MCYTINNINTGITKFYSRSQDELDSYVVEMKKKFGDDLLILGHHYQKDEIIKHADITGDSLFLSKAAANSNANHIIFCGVHFMAQTAAILKHDHQRVYLPDASAGCPMADMANLAQVEKCLKYLTNIYGKNSILPITYVNSTAEIKAFVGENNGVCVTSSNAERVLKWALNQNKRVLFLPDQHLGRNTAHKLKVNLKNVLVYDQNTEKLLQDEYYLQELSQDDNSQSISKNNLNTNQIQTLEVCQQNQLLSQNELSKRENNSSLQMPPNDEQIEKAKIILWNGYCAVHQQFTLDDVKIMRSSHPNAKIIVHPECAFDVVNNSDMSGSTNELIETVKNTPNDCEFAIGTDNNLVERIKYECESNGSGKKIHILNNYSCPCVMMNRIRLPHLALNLENIENLDFSQEITVEHSISKNAKKALDKMLEFS